MGILSKSPPSFAPLSWTEQRGMSQLGLCDREQKTHAEGSGWLNQIDGSSVVNTLLIMVHLYGYYMVIIWLLYGYYMVIIWLLYGYYMAIIWLLYG